MIRILVPVFVGIFTVLLLEELHRRKEIRTESSRKTVHIIHGLILAVWPFFVGWNIILAIEVANLFFMAVVRKYMPLESQHKVNRKTWGEFFFAFGVIVSILVGAPRWVFVLAVLHLALADAAAALIGQKYGKKNGYVVFGQQKSIIGSAAFFAVSAVLIIGAFIFVPGYITAENRLALLSLPFLTTAMENVGVYGTDNLLIPLSVMIVLGL